MLLFGTLDEIFDAFQRRYTAQGPSNMCCTVQQKTLTDGAANSLLNVSLPTLQGCSGTLMYQVFATDGVDVQIRRGKLQYSAVNKGGVFTSEIVIINEGVSASLGTLTATFSILPGANLITIRVTPVGSLVETQLRIFYAIINHSEQQITFV